MLVFFSEDKCTSILNTNKIKRIVSTGESKIREGITVDVDYGGVSYEAQIVRMHGKFYYGIYIFVCFALLLK